MTDAAKVTLKQKRRCGIRNMVVEVILQIRLSAAAIRLSAIRILPLGPDVAHIFAPTRVTLDAAGGQPATYAFLINEFAIRTGEGWRISAIVPVPAP